MGKRDHGRLVHEVRDALIKGGFKPTCIVSTDSPTEKRGIRAPGFKVEKHTDSKSARLSFHPAQKPPGAEADWHATQTFGGALMKRLAGYHATLEREGFICIKLDSSDPLASFSLWRRSGGIDTTRRVKGSEAK